MQLIVVSGRSGSGKTVALRVLEDLGYYCVDNLPVNLLPQLIVSVESQYDKLAVSIDVRNLPSDPEKLENLLAQVRNEGRVEFSSFFFDADNGTLLKRYGESRRLHPLSRNKLSLDEAIREETHLLAPISSTADLRIDTTTLSIHDLSELIKNPGTRQERERAGAGVRVVRLQVRHSQGCRLRVRCSLPAQSALDPRAQAVYRQG